MKEAPYLYDPQVNLKNLLENERPFRIIPFSAGLAADWNQFNRGAANGLFLFDRGYMDYHQDRFRDHSLLIYAAEELVAILPLHAREEQVISHGGLTFGGLVVSGRLRVHDYLRVFETVLDYLQDQGFRELIYKSLPYIFHRQPVLDDQYALFRHRAELINRQLSSFIDLQAGVNYSKGRRWALKKALRSELIVQESQDFTTFMELVSDILTEKYGVVPTHSPGEMALLAARFPEEIRLLTVYRQEEMIGGTVLYLSDQVVHMQYIATSEAGKAHHALDLIMDTVIRQYRESRRYLSFGISPGDDPFGLNPGLIRNKESYGARSLPHDIYRLDLKSV